MVVLVRRHSLPLLVPVESSSSGVNRSQAFEASSILGNGSSDGLGVPLESVPREVGDVVAREMVIDVVRDTSLAAEKLSLLLGLDDLSAGEETTRSNAEVEETSIVTAAAEVGRNRIEAILGEEVLKEKLGLAAAGGASLVESAAVAIVDAQDVVGRGDHVEVEVQADLGGLFGREVLGVVVRTKQAELLGGPEADADGVVDGVAGELLSDLEDADDAGAVVVNAWAGLHGIGVAADDEDGILVAADSLCDDVLTMVDDQLMGVSTRVRGLNLHSDVVDVAVNIQSDFNGLAANYTLNPRGCVGLVNTHSGHVVTLRARGRAKGTASKRLGNIVVDDGTSSAGSTSKSGLLTEWTGATLNQSNLALDLSRVVGCLAAKIGDGDELSGYFCTRRVLEDPGHGGNTIDSQLALHVAVQRGEWLPVHSPVVAESLDALNEVGDGVVVAFGANDSVAVRGGVCNVLQILSLEPEVLNLDSCLQSRRVDRLARLPRLARLAGLSRLSRFTRLARVVRRVRRLLAWALVLRRRIGVLRVLRRGSSKTKRGREDGGGELHGTITNS